VNYGNRMGKVKLKLKGLKHAIKQGKEKVSNSDRMRIQKILEEIENLDQNDDERNLQDDLRVRRIGLLRN